MPATYTWITHPTLPTTSVAKIAVNALPYWTSRGWTEVPEPGVISAPDPVGKYLCGITSAFSTANQAGDQAVLLADNIPASWLKVGKRYEFYASGDFDNIAASGAFTCKVKVNGIILKNFNIAVSQTNANTTSAFSIEGRLKVEALGTSGQLTTIVDTLTVTTAVGARGTATWQSIQQSIDLSAGLQFQLYVTTVTPNAGNILRVHDAYIAEV